MPTHLNLRYQEIEDLWPGVERFQALAKAYGIDDIFQDGGGKLLQILIAVGLDNAPGRLGPDALDRIGNEYEIKTLDLDKGVLGFSTNHHVKQATIDGYRQRQWVFAMYRGIMLHEAYIVKADDLNLYFMAWEMKLLSKEHLNNPKIPAKFVRKVGQVAYLKNVVPAYMEGKAPMVSTDDD